MLDKFTCVFLIASNIFFVILSTQTSKDAIKVVNHLHNVSDFAIMVAYKKGCIDNSDKLNVKNCESKAVHFQKNYSLR